MEYKTVDEAGKYKTILLKGTSGSGKSTKAAHFPSPVFFDFDHNLSGLRQLPPKIRDTVKVIDPAMKGGKILKGRMVWDNFIDLVSQVGADPDVGTIVIDSLTTAQEKLMDKILGNEDPKTQMERQHWGAIGRYWKTLGEELLCASDLDKHVIFIAHERLLEDGTGISRFTLNMGGSMKDSFDLYFTDVWRAFLDIPARSSEGVVYKVATQSQRSFTAKSSMDIPAVFNWDEYKEELLLKL